MSFGSWGRGFAGALVLVLMLGLSACGGGDSSTEAEAAGAPPIVPRKIFEKKSKAICDRANEERGEGIEALYERRARETGEGLGAVGTFEGIQKVAAPSLRREIPELEAVGLPKGAAYEAEEVWQTLRTVLHEVEVEGWYAWRSAKLLPPFRNRAHKFGLDGCIIN